METNVVSQDSPRLLDRMRAEIRVRHFVLWRVHLGWEVKVHAGESGRDSLCPSKDRELALAPTTPAPTDPTTPAGCYSSRGGGGGAGR